jgi:hypothetical protein
MELRRRLNNIVSGVAGGIILPVIVFFLVWMISSREIDPGSYIDRILSANVLTHFISISVFSNLFLFLLCNRFDMLRCSKGILGITIIWALLTFAIKIF